MSRRPPGEHGPRERRLRAGGWLVLAVALGALAATASASLDGPGRARLLRVVGILVAGGLAVGTPHLLFPDPALRRLQLANPAARRLLRRQLGRWLPGVAVLTVPVAVIAGTDGGRIAEGVLSMAALGLFAWARASTLGIRVRSWERGDGGAAYRRAVARHPRLRFQVPDELVPSFALTAEVFTAGSLLAIAGQAAGEGLGTLVAPVVLVLVTLAHVARERETFDQAFWTTNGVWEDAFQPSGGSQEGRAPLAIEAVYWAPRALRARVWAGLVSLDRRLPLGRIATLGLALLALTHLAGAGEGLRLATLALYVAAVNGAVVLTAVDAVVPGPLAHRLGGIGGWALARFLMNVRWLPPLAATCLLLVWLADGVGWTDLAVWTLVDLGAAALSAVGVTVVSHTRFHRLHA